MSRFKQIRVSATALAVCTIMSSTTINAFAQESTPVGSSNAYSALTIDAHYQDDTFKQLQAASKANDSARAANLADQLSDYPIPSYVSYYRLKPQLYNSDGSGNVNAPDDEIKSFLSANDGQAIADRLRNDYLYVLAARRDWTHFNQQYSQFALKDDVAIKCYDQMGQLDNGTSTATVVSNTKKILIDSKAANAKACQQLVQQIASRGAAEEDINYFAALSAYNSASQGQAIAAYSRQSSGAARMSSLISQAGNDSSASVGGAASAAAGGMSAQQGALTQAYVGYAQARRAASDASSYFNNAYAQYKQLQLPDDILGWQARAGMRAGDWALVGNAIDKMSDTERNTSIWLYWRGRAYSEQNQDTQAALFYEQAAAYKGGFDFYGLMAREALGQTITLPAKTNPTEADVAAMSKTPGFAQARKFYAMDMTFEGNREWNFPLRQLNDSQLIAAAEYGRRVGLLDRMINTSDRTSSVYNFQQRYPTPYLSIMENRAEQAGIPAAWGYGIIRQESRFVTLAKSSANANGLMQIIPSTARLVARSLGLNNFTLDQLGDIDTNVQLGTAYLAQTRDRLDGSLPLASAGYNAGPGRPPQWKNTLTRSVDGAIFAETIPIAETRGYVKNVMANTIIYHLVMKQRAPKLKDLMGTVSPY